MNLAARDPGFDHVELLPFGGRGECSAALKIHSIQIALREEVRVELPIRFSRMLPLDFAHVAGEDNTPSPLIVQ